MCVICIYISGMYPRGAHAPPPEIVDLTLNVNPHEYLI